jgi:ABC-type glycerol-3-phosphate transport system substrate-binding protein
MKLRSACVRVIALMSLVVVVGLMPPGEAAAQPAVPQGGAARLASLTIVSTLPESYARAQVRAFEQANPGTRVELIIQRPEQILATLRSNTPAQRPHLIWSASAESFSAAAADGLLLGIDGEPQPMGGALPVDQGLTARAQHLIRIALARPAAASAPAWPERWQDIAQGECTGALANPFAAPGGLGNLLIESALQDRGWEAGWALLSGLVANSASGDTGGLTPLSLVFEDAATDPSLEVQPAFAVLARTRLALVAAGSRDMRLAQRFVRFITAPPAAFSAPAATPSGSIPSATTPLASSSPAATPPADTPARSVRRSPPAVAQYLSVDLAQMERREPVVSMLARQWLVSHAPQLRQSCAALRDGTRRTATTTDERAARQTLAQARALAYGPALPERMLADESVVQAFNPQIREALRRPRVAALESQWAAAALERHTQALGLLAQSRLTP